MFDENDNSELEYYKKKYYYILTQESFKSDNVVFQDLEKNMKKLGYKKDQILYYLISHYKDTVEIEYNSNDLIFINMNGIVNYVLYPSIWVKKFLFEDIYSINIQGNTISFFDINNKEMLKINVGFSNRKDIDNLWDYFVKSMNITYINRG